MGDHIRIPSAEDPFSFLIFFFDAIYVFPDSSFFIFFFVCFVVFPEILLKKSLSLWSLIDFFLLFRRGTPKTTDKTSFEKEKETLSKIEEDLDLKLAQSSLLLSNYVDFLSHSSVTLDSSSLLSLFSSPPSSPPSSPSLPSLSPPLSPTPEDHLVLIGSSSNCGLPPFGFSFSFSFFPFIFFFSVLTKRKKEVCDGAVNVGGPVELFLADKNGLTKIEKGSVCYFSFSLSNFKKIFSFSNSLTHMFLFFFFSAGLLPFKNE